MTTKLTRFRPLTLMLALTGLTACTNITYRCPLDPGKTPDSPTACAGMHDALTGSKRGTGGKTSVLTDEQGRLVPQGLRENKPAVPLDAPLPGAAEPYRTASGEPVYEPGRKFQVWSQAFVDAEGNLHDGHHAWFATPDRWSYGSLREAESAEGGLLKPAQPGTRPSGVKMAPDAARPPQHPAAPANPQVQAQAQREKDKAALQNLSSMATSMAKPEGQPAGAPTANAPAATGITAPAVMLGN